MENKQHVSFIVNALKAFHLDPLVTCFFFFLSLDIKEGSLNESYDIKMLVIKND